MTSWIGRGALAVVIALLLMGGAAVLIEVQSPSGLYWTGERVDAVSESGIIYYRYGGAQFTVNDDHRSAKDPRRVPVTVFVDPADATQVLVDGPARWVDGAFVIGWFVAAVAVLPFAVARQRRRRRRQAEFSAAGSWGPLRRQPPVG